MFRTRDKLSEDTGLSFDQIKRAISLLRGLDFITSKQHIVGKKNIAHYRVSELGLTAYYGTCCTTQVARNCTTQSGAELHHPCGAELHHSYSKQQMKTETTKRETKFHSEILEKSLPDKNSQDLPGAGATETLNAGATPSPEIEMLRPKSVKDLTGLIEAHNKIHKADGAAGVYKLWSVTRNEQTGVIHNLSNADKAKLKMFMGKCGKAEATKVLDYTLRHWLEFTSTVEQDAGTTKSPAQPQIEFLLKYTTIAVQLLPVPKKPTVPKQEAKTEINVGKPVQSIANVKAPTADTPKTKAELLALINSED